MSRWTSQLSIDNLEPNLREIQDLGKKSTELIGTATEEHDSENGVDDSDANTNGGTPIDASHGEGINIAPNNEEMGSEDAEKDRGVDPSEKDNQNYNGNVSDFVSYGNELDIGDGCDDEDDVSSHGAECRVDSGQSPVHVQASSIKQALEAEIDELKVTITTHAKEMLVLLEDNRNLTKTWKTNVRNLNSLFHECAYLRRKNRGLDEQLDILKHENAKLKEAIHIKESEISKFNLERAEYERVIREQEKTISDVKDDASVHNVTHKAAIDVEIICLKEEIIENNHIISQQRRLIEDLQSQRPTEEYRALQIVLLQTRYPVVECVDLENEE
ncbi:hypothetical protein QJS10_CPB17g00550 [Acorus calamus]|uniref:Uncharacterized protein n=1 Tax=Acorus calamus TaxID=4465 RepID=A0AAV9CVK6_ACOCL|nr:hypothetical protein QJS10_CPB17g00550 [Acorus calamus]